MSSKKPKKGPTKANTDPAQSVQNFFQGFSESLAARMESGGGFSVPPIPGLPLESGNEGDKGDSECGSTPNAIEEKEQLHTKSPGRTGNLDKASGEEEKPAGQNGRLSDDFNRLTGCAHRVNPPIDRLSDEIGIHAVEPVKPVSQPVDSAVSPFDRSINGTARLTGQEAQIQFNPHLGQRRPTANRIQVLTYLVAAPKDAQGYGLTTIPEMQTALGIPYGTIKSIMQSLSSAGVITREYYISGVMRGIRYRINQDMADQILSVGRSTDQPPFSTGLQVNRLTDSAAAFIGQPAKLPHERLDEYKVYLSFSQEDLEIRWPNLAGALLTPQVLRMAIEERIALGIGAESLAEDLTILNYNLAQDFWLAEIKHNLLGVIRAGIANGNPVPAPGYKSLMQKRLEAREAQIKVQEDMLERLKKVEKKAWLAGLSKESREAIARQGSGPEEEFNLNFYFNTFVWPEIKEKFFQK